MSSKYFVTVPFTGFIVMEIETEEPIEDRDQAFSAALEAIAEEGYDWVDDIEGVEFTDTIVDGHIASVVENELSWEEIK